MAVRELLGIAGPTALGNLCEYLPVAVGMAIVGRMEGASGPFRIYDSGCTIENLPSYISSMLSSNYILYILNCKS